MKIILLVMLRKARDELFPAGEIYMCQTRDTILPFKFYNNVVLFPLFCFSLEVVSMLCIPQAFKPKAFPVHERYDHPSRGVFFFPDGRNIVQRVSQRCPCINNHQFFFLGVARNERPS